MKKYKTYLFVLFLGFLITFLLSCTQTEKSEFGPVQTGFEADSVYHAKTDGLLSVEMTGNIISIEHIARIYSDDTPDPTTQIGIVGNPGVSTLPVRKNDYWKVVQEGPYISGGKNSITISWTPLE